MINSFFTSVLFLLFNVTAPTTKTESPAIITTTETNAVSAMMETYNTLNANSYAMPSFESFAKAAKGFDLLKSKGKIRKNLLTLIDFSKSSNTKRLWIINMDTKTILYNTLVAHGRNSGNEFATKFLNAGSSFQSSLGFYATGELYQGKHGESLRLDGLEPGINSNARNRAVVMHAADYVSESFIKQHHRLGRSQGCPALPNHLNKEIINLIQGKSCLFIYHPSKQYEKSTKLVS